MTRALSLLVLILAPFGCAANGLPEETLVGQWISSTPAGTQTYVFRADGTYSYDATVGDPVRRVGRYETPQLDQLTLEYTDVAKTISRETFVVERVGELLGFKGLRRSDVAAPDGVVGAWLGETSTVFRTPSSQSWSAPHVERWGFELHADGSASSHAELGPRRGGSWHTSADGWYVVTLVPDDNGPWSGRYRPVGHVLASEVYELHR